MCPKRHGLGLDSVNRLLRHGQCGAVRCGAITHLAASDALRGEKSSPVGVPARLFLPATLDECLREELGVARGVNIAAVPRNAQRSFKPRIRPVLASLLPASCLVLARRRHDGERRGAPKERHQDVQPGEVDRATSPRRRRSGDGGTERRTCVAQA